MLCVPFQSWFLAKASVTNQRKVISVGCQQRQHGNKPKSTLLLVTKPEAILSVCKTGAMTDLAEVTRDEYSPGKSEMNDALLEMFSSRQERHPITLQSDMMLGEFQQRHDPAPNADAQMAQGFHHCLLELEDPAMAIQHITFCMFEVLKVTHLLPSFHTPVPTCDACACRCATSTSRAA